MYLNLDGINTWLSKECYENEKWEKNLCENTIKYEWCNMLSNEEFYSGNFYFVTMPTQICDFDDKFFFFF